MGSRDLDIEKVHTALDIFRFASFFLIKFMYLFLIVNYQNCKLMPKLTLALGDTCPLSVEHSPSTFYILIKVVKRHPLLL